MKKGDKKREKKALARHSQQKMERSRRNALQTGDTSAVRHAREYPLLGCWTYATWQDLGMAPVIVARRQSNGSVVFGNYLVDFYCLGVKDCFTRANIPYSDFVDESLPTMMHGHRQQTLSPELAHEMIYGSIEYAARWGFQPHPDFGLAQMVLEPPETYPMQGRITFGREGKPFYVSGPRDDTEAIYTQLRRTAGDGNFDFLMHIGTPPEGMLEIVAEDEENEDT